MIRILAQFVAAVSVGLPLLAFGAGLSNPALPPPGSSAGFRDGYAQGCLTGFQDARRAGYEQAGRKDVARYLRDADYKAGFDAAYRACYEEQIRNPKSWGDAGI